MILTTSGTERFHYFLEYDYYIGYAGFGHSIMFSPLLFISSTSLEHGQEDILEKQITIANCLFLESIGIWKISLEPTALLIRDFQNYVTALHPDAAHRLLALMFYMPQDDSTPYLGTSIYRPINSNDEFEEIDGMHHYSRDAFKEVKRMDYLSNSFYVFFRTNDSFYGVEPVERNPLLYYIRVREANS